MKTRRQALRAAIAVVISPAANVLSLIRAQQVRTTASNSPTYGPVGGSLVLLGGNPPSPAINSAFATLAGGASSHIVVIPTASIGDDGPPGWVPWLMRRMRETFGVAEVTVLHSLDRVTADSDRFVEPLRNATGVWILGGFPGQMVYSYLGTRTERAIHELLDRGGVVGGESAGAMIQASWLDTTDDDFTPEIRALIKTYGRGGFGLLKRTAVFPHFDVRGSTAAVRFSTEYPDQLGIGIDNETALIIKGDRVEVIGQGSVSIYDGRRGGGADPVVLRSGDRYEFALDE